MNEQSLDFTTRIAMRTAEHLNSVIPNVTIPAGKSGNAEIDHIEITPDSIGLSNMRMVMNGQSHRAYVPGSYTRLLIDGSLMMTDTPAEKRDHLKVVKSSHGDCLITGLGIGMVANAMALREQVESVTVLEINPGVIELVAPTLHEKVTVIEADAFEWPIPKAKKWDVVWHDIWQAISLDDCESRAKLSRRYGKRWRTYHSSWAKDEIIRMQQAERDHRRW